MNITLIYPDIIHNLSSWRGYYHYGIGYLAASLKKVGHNVSLLHIAQPIKKEELFKRMNREKVDLVGFSTTTNMWPFVSLWSKWIKKIYSVPIICGGVHPTLCPEEVIRTDSIDFICRGEGEEPLVELCNAMQDNKTPTDILNIWAKKKGEIFKNKMAPLKKDLDALPFSDREIFDYHHINPGLDNILCIMASRGCPYDCSYCCNKTLKDLYHDSKNYVRFRSVRHVVEEIKILRKLYPSINHIWFDDDILPLKSPWFEEFSSTYKEEIGLPYTCCMRPNLINKGVARLLKDSGCKKLSIGIESGNNIIRNNILNRRISDEQIRNAFRICDEFDIKTHSFNIVGIPQEDMAAMLDTIKINSQIGPPNSMQVTISYPYPGTVAHNYCKEKGFIPVNEEQKHLSSYMEDTILDYPKILKNRVLFIKRYFRPLVKLYKALNKDIRIIKIIRLYILLDKILSNKLVAYLIFPFFIRFYDILRKIKHIVKPTYYSSE